MSGSSVLPQRPQPSLCFYYWRIFEGDLMEAVLRVALMIAIFCLLLISGSSSFHNKESLGIDPQDLRYYKSSVIKCKDGSKEFTKEQLNDEFCDCPDGTDEPGTSACPEGKFYCQNVGHIPTKIFSSRVNDGICDCCDGGDEYNSNANCPNTCWEAGKAAREKLKKKIEMFKEGVVLRKEEIEKANIAYAKDVADLEKLKSDEKMLKELVQKLREQKERIDKLEEERLKKENEKKRLIEDNEKSNYSQSTESETIDGTIGNHEQDGPMSSPDIAIESGNYDRDESQATKSRPVEQIGEVLDDPLESTDDDVQEITVTSPDELSQQEKGDSVTSEELSREELGRLVASRWTGEDADQKTDKIVEEQMNLDPVVANEHRGYISEPGDGNIDKDDEDDDDSYEDDKDDDFEDDHASSEGSYNVNEYANPDPADTTEAISSSLFDKIQQSVQNVLQAFNFFRTPVNISDAARIRKEYDDTNSKLSKVQSRVSSLTEKLKHDFGKEKDFYLFYDQCFESKQDKYVYKICPFKQSSQVEGYSNTQLGSWEKFEESYRVMLFSHGDKCWNGPDRSLKVRLRCGLKAEISDVDEPSRCDYTALMSSPLLCLEDKLKELEKKLEQLNTGKLQSNDEL